MPTDEVRRRISALIGLCVEDRGLGPALADLLDDVDCGIAHLIRRNAGLRLLIEATSWAEPHGVAQGRSAKRRLIAYGRNVWFDRRSGVTQPDCLTATNISYRPTTAEAEGDSRYEHWLLCLSPERRLHQLRSFAHCCRLVDRAMDGEQSPPDVVLLYPCWYRSITSVLLTLRPRVGI